MTSSKSYLQKNVALAWPLAINVLLVQSMLMIDTVLVAPLGELPVAAMGIATALVAFALGIELAIGNGVQLLVGRAHGSGRQDDLVVAFWVGLFVTGLVAILFFLAVVLFAPQIVAALSDDTLLQNEVLAYLAITKYIIIFSAFTVVATAFYNGRSNTTVPLKGFVLEIPSNALLSYLLIYGFGEFNGLGLEGAAWGSLAAIILRAGYFFLVMQLDQKVNLSYPSDRVFRAELRPQLDEISPIAVNFFVLFIGASVYQLLYAQLDLTSFVAITLIFPWLRIGTQIVAAWAQASAINISQALGGNQTQHLRDFVSACTRTALALSAVVALLFLLLSQCVHLIYTNIEPETYAALSVIAPLYIILPLIRGYNSVSGNILRALGESKRVLKLNFTAQWLVSLPLCACLILYFEAPLFWAFAVMPLEEIIKVYHFHRYTKLRLAGSTR